VKCLKKLLNKTTELTTDFTAHDRVVEQDPNLELYLAQIRKIFDIHRIINAPRDKSHIINYYLASKLSYRLAWNLEGFIHCGISYDRKRKKEDFREQARIVNKHIKDKNAKKVLELGYGLGSNSACLARRNPQVTFDAIDISNKPLRSFTTIPNLNFCFGDYHNLSQFNDDSYDIVFVIEALCYSTQKLEVFREVKKKLKNDGFFIVFDPYARNRAIPLSESEKTMWELIYRGSAVETFECVDDVEYAMRKEFSIVIAEDLSACVLPSLEAQESRARHYFNHPAVARVINKVLPFDVVRQLPQILLMPTSVRRQVGCYYLHVLKNDR
jgi:ubiquinone/menaquinone biosynthesis C-methylase UbiE